MNEDQKITYFGESNFRNQKVKFGIKTIDRRKHIYVVGKTGMGKSTMLENMAMQDIQSGEGLAFIDPHGETASKLLDFVPKHRINDVIYFDPADMNFPIGFNVMEDVGPDRRHFVASGLMGVFKKIFGPDVWSARMEYILGHTVLALLEYPGSTLLSINPMLAIKDFRKKVVENVTDPVVKAFWTQEFAKYTERFAAEATPAIQNKVGQLTSNPLIRNIVGQKKSSFDIRKVMDEKKILILNLAKGRVGEDTASLLGSMMVTKLYLAAMSRVDIAKESQRSDFFLYVDEFQNYATESFASILSEARKYRLSLTVAHQYMAQLAEEVRDAVIGNVGTMVTFRAGAEDAEFLEKELAPSFEVNDIVNLGFAQIYLKLMIDGVASYPFSATTLPPIEQKEESNKETIIETSRKSYAIPRAEIDDVIRKWSDELSGDSASSEPRVRMSPGEAPADRPAVKLFDAVCAVCGKKTQVPFEPDPSRPVFCKDHIGLAGKFNESLKSYGKAPASPAGSNFSPRNQAPAERFSRPVARETFERVPATPPRGPLMDRGFVERRTSQETVSLRDLRPPQFRNEPKPQPKNDHLQALRDALKQSLSNNKEKAMTAIPAEKAKMEIPREPVKVAAPPKDANSGTLKPGDTLEI